MMRMKMSEGGRVVVPVEIRRALEIKDGDTVVWEMRDGVAVLTTRLAQLRKAQEMMKQLVPGDVLLSDELIAERRAENARDEAQ